MALSSPRFANNDRLQAASENSPPLRRGETGDGVATLQQALVDLGLNMPISFSQGSADGVYGAETERTVRQFQKQQGFPASGQDGIAGRDTLQELDRLFASASPGPAPSSGPLRIDFLSPQRSVKAPKPGAKVNLPFLSSLRNARVGGGAPSSDPSGVPSLVFPGNLFLPPKLFNMVLGDTALFQVVNGVGGVVSVSDDRLAVLTDPPSPVVNRRFPVSKNPHQFQVFAKNPGACAISVSGLRAPADFSSVLLRIRNPDDSRFHPGVHHDHPPCNQWQKIRNSPNVSVGDVETTGDRIREAFLGPVGVSIINGIIRNSDTPREAINSVLALGRFRPLPRQHIDHYLFGGGRDFVEDENIRDWLIRDQGIRQKLQREVARATQSQIGASVIQGNFEFPQSAYQDEDFKNAWGAIDQVDWEADLVAGTLRVRFQDRYEWHPVFRGLYVEKEGDEVRPTNGIHAAFVELKNEGAADYWMKGEFTVGLP
jgi:peptidoglycan hydrolase-like protein with peptidoglycan-binding domain